MMKVKLKISGGFRTPVRKQRQNVFEAIQDALLEQPFIPSMAE